MPFVTTRRSDDDCNPATCPNGKCFMTGECIEQVARDMRALGDTLPNATTIVAIEELESPVIGGPNVSFRGEARADLDALLAGDHEPIPEIPVSPPLAPAAPRQRIIDTDSATRKTFPMARGLLDYFPDALAEVARVSYLGNQKHNAGEPMHHARGKSTDHADCIIRHLVGRGGFDGDIRESAALAWRALALLQEELEQEMGLPLPRGAY
jgi:hypothetical protein